jgi:hypothetical protein
MLTSFLRSRMSCKFVITGVTLRVMLAESVESLSLTLRVAERWTPLYMNQDVFVSFIIIHIPQHLNQEKDLEIVAHAFAGILSPPKTMEVVICSPLPL